MKASKKNALLLFVNIIVTLLVIVTGYISTKNISEISSRMVTDGADQIESIYRISMLSEGVVAKSLIMLTTTDKPKLKAILKEYESLNQQLMKTRTNYESNKVVVDNSNDIYKAYVSNWNSIEKMINDLKTLLLKYDQEGAMILMGSKGRALFDNNNKYLADLSEVYNRNMTLLKKRAQSIRARVLILILTLAIVGTAAIIATFFFLMKSYRNLCSVSRDLEAASNELKSSSIRQSDSATNQSALISEVAASTLQVSSISNNIADSMSKIALGAIRTVESCDEGHQAVANGRKSMSKVNDQVQLIANHMVELGEKTQQIDKVLEIINELTEQTNLLSLNATIESAGAGEAGKRFAVVADEVRKLAERAMESTKEIKRLVLDIQETANTTVMVTEEGTNVVEESAILFGKITDSIAEIATFASETSASTTDIKETTFEQNSAIGMISDSLGDINDAARTTENIAKDNFKNVEELTCITDEIKKIV